MVFPQYESFQNRGLADYYVIRQSFFKTASKKRRNRSCAGIGARAVSALPRKKEMNLFDILHE